MDAAFLDAVDADFPKTVDKAVALLWLVGRDSPNNALSAKEISRILEDAGFPKQNYSRLDDRLRADTRTAVAPGGAWKLRPAARKEIDQKLTGYGAKAPPAESDSFIPRENFEGSKDYIKRVVRQINLSYDGELFDCCAVMCRRLLETLIIETFESAGRENEIKGADGHYIGFGEMLPVVENAAWLNLSRLGLKAIKEFKRLGDLSAHNRRYNAKRSDLDPHKPHLRLAAEELGHLAVNKPSAI